MKMVASLRAKHPDSLPLQVRFWFVGTLGLCYWTVIERTS
jgi:hypothetical protein